MADDDFLKFFSDTLASVAGIDQAAEAKAPLDGKLVYIGFDDATRTVFHQNFSERMPFVETADLGLLKQLLSKNEVALLVFDSTSFVKPGMQITRFIKEKGMPIRVAHVFSPQRVTEDYEKYRQYHVHLQPDYRGTTDEVFVVVDAIRKDFGI